TAELAISAALRLLAMRIAVWMVDGSCRSACKLSKVSNVQAGSTPSSHCRTCGSSKKSSATMPQLAKSYSWETGGLGRSHSLSFDQRRRPETLRTAMATLPRQRQSVYLAMTGPAYGQLAQMPGWSLQRIVGRAAGKKLSALAWN